MTKDLILKLRERKLGDTSSSFVQAITPREEIRHIMNKRHLEVVNASADSSLLVFRPDGHCILSIQSNGNSHIWDWESGSHMKTLACGEDVVLDAIWCEKDVIVTCAANGGTCVSSCLTTEILKHASATALAQSQEYNHLVFSCGLDGSVYQIDSRAKNAVQLMSQKKKWNSIASDPTCFQIALGSENDTRVKLYDIRKFQCELQAPDLSMPDGRDLTKIIGLTYSAAGDLLVTYPSCIQMVQKGQSKANPFGSDLSNNNNPVLLTKAYFLGLTHRYIVCGVNEGYCIIWDNKVTSGFNFAKFLDTQGAIRCIMPHPRSLALATTGSNQVVKVWEPSARLVSRDAEEELDSALLDIVGDEDDEDDDDDEDDEDDDDDGDDENVENNDEDDNEDPDDDDGDDDGDVGGNIDDGNGGDNSSPSEHGHTRVSGSGYDTDEGPVRKKQKLMEGECSSRKELRKSSGIVLESLNLNETASPARDKDGDSSGSGDDEDDDGDSENEEDDDENDDEDPDDDKDKDGDSSTGDDDGDGSGGNTNDGNGGKNSGTREHEPAKASGSGSETDGPVRKKQKLIEGNCSSHKELCKPSSVMPGSFDLSETTSYEKKVFEFTNEIVGSEINVDIIEIYEQGVILGSKKKRLEPRWGTKEELLLSLLGLPDMQMERLCPLYRQERMTCEQTSWLYSKVFGINFQVCTFGKSHSCCPPNMPLSEADIQFELDWRPGQSRITTPWKETGICTVQSRVGAKGTFMMGSVHNDGFYVKASGRIRTETNQSGCIEKKQGTVTLDREKTELIARGRDDPCVVPRGTLCFQNLSVSVCTCISGLFLAGPMVDAMALLNQLMSQSTK